MAPFFPPGQEEDEMVCGSAASTAVVELRILRPFGATDSRRSFMGVGRIAWLWD